MRASSIRRRLSRSGSFEITVRSIRYEIVSPSTVASSSASALASRSWCARVRFPRKPSHANRQSSVGPPFIFCAVSSVVSSS